MNNLLSPSAIAQYRRDGYTHPHRVMTAEEAGGYLSKLEAFEKDLGAPVSGNYRQKTHLLFTWAEALIRHSKILDAVEDLLGPNLLCWSSGFFNKEPHTPNYVSWHQDATYWGLRPYDEVTAWLAFTPSNTQNGAMRVIPGSHKEQVPHEDSFAEVNMLSRGQEITVDIDESRAVDLVLDPGEISLHHILTFHSSPPNASNERRIGFAIRYVPPHVKQMGPIQDTATLVRGEDTEGYWELEPSPERDLDPPMIAYHKKIIARQTKVLFDGTARGRF